MPNPDPLAAAVEAMIRRIALYRYELPEQCQSPLDEREARIALLAAAPALLAAVVRALPVRQIGGPCDGMATAIEWIDEGDAQIDRGALLAALQQAAARLPEAP